MMTAYVPATFEDLIRLAALARSEAEAWQRTGEQGVAQALRAYAVTLASMAVALRPKED